MSKNEDELGEIADIYNVLKSDAKTIVDDLHDGVTMWREAAAGAIASVGFILFLTMDYLAYSWTNEPIVLVRWLTVGLFLVMAVVMAYIGIAGFVKYFRLRKKYSGLFERASKL